MYNIQPQSPFFTRLPPEIRLRIYSHCGLHHTFQSKAFPYSDYNKKVGPLRSLYRTYPALLRTCKRIDAEARSSLFSSAVLHLNDCAPCYWFVRVSDCFDLGAVRSLYITYRYEGLLLKPGITFTPEPSFFLDQVNEACFVHVHFVRANVGIYDQPDVLNAGPRYRGALFDIISQLRELRHLVLSGDYPRGLPGALRTQLKGVKVEMMPPEERVSLPKPYGSLPRSRIPRRPHSHYLYSSSVDESG